MTSNSRSVKSLAGGRAIGAPSVVGLVRNQLGESVAEVHQESLVPQIWFAKYSGGRSRVNGNNVDPARYPYLGLVG
jgi:hypothetical protein